MTKVLANRLKDKMECLVDRAQTAFIKGRYTLEGVAQVQEVV
jgi:hypothetical protein